MAQRLRAVVIGCGVGGEGKAGVHSIGYLHGETYRQSDQVDLVAAADLNDANAAAYATEFGLERTYRDYREMLAREQPDIVSVCTWPPLHAEMTIAAAEAGAKGVWCEKPMTLSLGDADRMLEACQRHGTKLVVNHQRRYLPRFAEARRLVAAGAIGEVLTIHAGIDDWDILSWGTHWIDMYRFLLGDRACRWVVAQVDARTGTRKYGHLVEDHTLACFAFDGGAHGFLETGRAVPDAPSIRISGKDGIIDILEGSLADGGKQLRYLSSATNGWAEPELEEVDSYAEPVAYFIAATSGLLADLVAWIEGGPEPAVSGNGARKTTEMIMAAYESARRGTIIDLPLTATDFPLEEIHQRAADREAAVAS